MSMPLRRPAPPRFCPPAFGALRGVRTLSRIGLALCCGVLAPWGPVAAGATPLPPQKPKIIQTIPPAGARRPLALRTAPLPPRRPAELDADEEEAVAPPQAEPAAALPDRSDADAPWREPVPVPAPNPRFAARAMPPADESRTRAVPLPPVRPDAESPTDAGSAVPDAEAASPDSPDASPAEMPEACAELVGAGVMAASLERGIPPKGACGLPQPVRLTGVRLENGRLVALKPAAVFRCEVAVALTRWLREALDPAVGGLGAEVSAVRIAASYDCRPRNRVAGAKMSEHGLGNAVDIGGFEMTDGRVWLVAKGGLPMPLRSTMKDSACDRFATVLGPGSDGFHEDHIHVDLAQRKRDYKMCRWNLDAGTAVAARKGMSGAEAPADTGGAPPPAPAGAPLPEAVPRGPEATSGRGGAAPVR